MSDIGNYQRVVNSKGRFDTTVDEGLRLYMIKVYNLMALGLIITGVMAFLISSFATTLDPAESVARFHGLMLTRFGVMMCQSPLSWIIMFAPLGAVLFIQLRLNSLSSSALMTSFLVYSALVGLSLSYIFLIYTSKSIVQTFFITSASFGCLSLYGYTTKRDLGPIGSFLIMGLFGICLIGLVNIFMRSSSVELALSVLGLFIFSGLTAYDTQRIKEGYSEHCGASYLERQSVMGALVLYMDFINIFLYLLKFTGGKRD
ncbi:Bax inhibitor-1/YccA family protein [Candidatus Liberibacter africanus]|uniref:BAX inhibitor (BI)-1/YccA family protein n=1 Tax=Candidatus Liberibacter africanus PTSAPSY TaxID=1277257 RepID=A0A0G3I2T8_LIBAF|nr:Bax inhibitor-1/YccA family protein [Candidatus Liberibacter africanus]AKK20204.1 hypothetical protein G293_02880 [Candidatus Liberibacter africanus PTSAPSY]QTP63984.1 Bax inhibitor-1/YccA family protein [Candidatus Liberibacter africanus]